MHSLRRPVKVTCIVENCRTNVLFITRYDNMVHTGRGIAQCLSCLPAARVRISNDPGIFSLLSLNEKPIFVLLFWELCCLCPNLHIHVSVSDLYICFEFSVLCLCSAEAIRITKSSSELRILVYFQWEVIPLHKKASTKICTYISWRHLCISFLLWTK